MNTASFNLVTVDAAALAHNYRLLKEHVGPSVEVMAMVKSDAYGHGLAEAAAAFGEAGCPSFGVAEIEEGVVLRESGCDGDIHVMLGFDKRSIEYFFSHRLIPVVFTRDDLSLLAVEAERRGQRLPVYLKFDCGMGRLGFEPETAADVIKKARSLSSLTVRGVMTHYPCADDTASESSLQVYRRFGRVLDCGQNNSTLRSSICNSGGILYFPQTHGDLVRAGIALYGYYPDGSEGRMNAGNGGLRPAMTFSTRVIQVKDVAAGSGISYGHTYVAEHPMKLAVLPVGYSNGYFRGLSNKAEILIHGKRAPLRGRVCMNLCMADVSHIDGVTPGDEAVLLGSQGDETIDADELGKKCDTISYEILCAVGNNNERHLK